MRRFWNLVKTVNVVNVDTLVDDPSEDLSWRPYLMTLVDDQLEDLADLTLIDENIARGNVSMRHFWTVVKTVNVVNVDTLVDDPSEDLSWRP